MGRVAARVGDRITISSSACRRWQISPGSSLVATTMAASMPLVAKSTGSIRELICTSTSGWLR
ncbi:hypothetical protein D3C72_2545980 [compost metagenome]